MSSLLENMKVTAQAVLDGFAVWHVDAVMKYRADDCMHQTLPRSLGHGPRNNAEYREYFISVMPLFEGMKFEVDQRIFDVDSRKAAIHCYGDAASPIGDYMNEYSMFMTFNEDGTKINRLTEMLDSAYSAEFIGKLMAHMKASGEGERDAIESAFEEVGQQK